MVVAPSCQALDFTLPLVGRVAPLGPVGRSRARVGVKGRATPSRQHRLLGENRRHGAVRTGQCHRCHGIGQVAGGIDAGHGGLAAIIDLEGDADRRVDRFQPQRLMQVGRGPVARMGEEHVDFHFCARVEVDGGKVAAGMGDFADPAIDDRHVAAGEIGAGIGRDVVAISEERQAIGPVVEQGHGMGRMRARPDQAPMLPRDLEAVAIGAGHDGLAPAFGKTLDIGHLVGHAIAEQQAARLEALAIVGEDGKIVGHTEAIEIGSGSIKLSGVISAANEFAREVAESSTNGFPWQASIGAQSEKVAFVDEGESVEVNGRKFTGPLYVARRAVLREVSFVALGADDQTTARVAAKHNQEPSSEIGVTDMGFEAWLEELGFQAEDLDETPGKWVRAPVIIEPEEARAMRAWSEKHVGGRYDIPGVLAFKLPFVRHRLNWWFCSEICTAALQQVGLLRGVKAHKTSPNSLFRMATGLLPREHRA